MQFSNPDFSAAVRTLTSLGAGTITPFSSIHTTLANGAQADLRPGAGIMRVQEVGGEGLANVTWNTGMFDGTTFRITFAGSSGGTLQTFMPGNAVFGPMIQNSGTVPGSYDLAGWDWHQ